MTGPLFNQLLSQFPAILAVTVFALSFHAKTRRGILLWQLASLAIWVLHFSLLHAWTGAALIVVNMGVTCVLVFKDSRKWLSNNLVLYGSLAALMLVTALTWGGFFSIFALLGVSTITMAKWQADPHHIRSIAILASIFWIAYDIFVGSYGGIIAESAIIISSIVSLMRSGAAARPKPNFRLR